MRTPSMKPMQIKLTEEKRQDFVSWAYGQSRDDSDKMKKVRRQMAELQDSRKKNEVKH